MPAIVTFDAPADHGEEVTGTHGCGVRTPWAAAVAAATCGLDIDWHMPKLATLTIGAKSMIVAAGLPSIVTRFVGSTWYVHGAVPKLHESDAVEMTGLATWGPPPVAARKRQAAGDLSRLFADARLSAGRTPMIGSAA